MIKNFKVKAARKGRSPKGRGSLRPKRPLSAKEKVALFRKIRAKSPVLKDFDIHAAIRAGRDDDPAHEP